MYTTLLNTLNQIAPLNPEEIKLIKHYFKPLSIKKGDFFLKSGDISRHVAFINKGLVRYFVYKNDEESTFEFTRENEFIADYQSFTKHCSSIQNIQAIEDCELLIINFTDVQDFFRITEHGNLLGRMIVEHRFEVMVNQLLAIYMQNQEERYKSFISNYYDLTQRIPQYHIASYIGVKPQSLSRIRKRYVKSFINQG